MNVKHHLPLTRGRDGPGFKPLARLLQLFNWFLPNGEGPDDPDRALRARLLVGTSFGLGLAGLFFLPLFYAFEGSLSSLTWATAAGALLMSANPFLMRQTGSPRLPAILLCLEFTLVQAAAAYLTGGFETLVLTWNPAIPLMATFLVGVWFGLACAGLLAAELLAFYFLERAGHAFVALPVTTDQHLWLTFLVVTMLIVFIAFLGWLYETSRRRALTLAAQTVTDLRRARDEAQAAGRAKSQFLANMSHELRTPLNAIIGLSDLLLDAGLVGEQRDSAQTISGSGRALLAIIDDILAYAKLEADKLELECRPFDLRNCIEDALGMVAVEAAEKGLELVYFLDDATPLALWGDGARLQQILLNVLGNAVKFTETGEVVVTVSGVECQGAAVTANATPDTGTPDSYELHFEVRDTGIGIPPDQLERIFEPFSQGDASRARRYGGTGLGLVISRHLTEMMGGTMWVESAGVPNLGSTFHFTIVVAAEPDRTAAAGGQLHPATAGKRLLIVDDNAAQRQALAQQVQLWGILPQPAASGPEALALLRPGASCDGALLDLQMPGMDGLTLATEIRRLDHLRALPIILLAPLGMGHTALSRTEQAAALAGLLTKPVRQSALHDALTSLFVTRTPDAEPAANQVSAQPGRHPLPLRILLADDNAVNRKVALYQLKQLGYEADVAANGLAVLEAIEQQDYDVILMDVHMPVMDGIEATRIIRQRWPKARRPAIIGLTASAMPGDREACRAAGMDDYLVKPVQVTDLFEALRRNYERRRSNAAAASPEGVASQDCSGHLNGSSPAGSGNQELEARIGDKSPDFPEEIIEAYLLNTPALLADMRQALATGDMAGLARAANALKTGSTNLRAVALSSLCRAVEVGARAGVSTNVAPALDLIEAEYDRVKNALK